MTIFPNNIFGFALIVDIHPTLPAPPDEPQPPKQPPEPLPPGLAHVTPWSGVCRDPAEQGRLDVRRTHR